eukprot:sb/3478575/
MDRGKFHQTQVMYGSKSTMETSLQTSASRKKRSLADKRPLSPRRRRLLEKLERRRILCTESNWGNHTGWSLIRQFAICGHRTIDAVPTSQYPRTIDAL